MLVSFIEIMKGVIGDCRFAVWLKHIAFSWKQIFMHLLNLQYRCLEMLCFSASHSSQIENVLRMSNDFLSR